GAHMILRRSALVLMALSLAALAAFVAVPVIGHPAREPDEGTGAHLWQLTMAAQLPLAAFFGVTWLPVAPRAAGAVFALQVLAVLTALRADPATAAIPVVILTASSDPGHEARANAVGVALFLKKPFGPIDLIAALRRVLGASVPAAPLGLHLVQTGALTPGQL